MRNARGFIALSLGIAISVASVSAAYAQGRGPSVERGPAAAAREHKKQHKLLLQQTAKRLHARLGPRGDEVALGRTKLFTIDDCNFTVVIVLDGACGPRTADEGRVDQVRFDWVSTYSCRGWCGILQKGFVACDPQGPGYAGDEVPALDLGFREEHLSVCDAGV